MFGSESLFNQIGDDKDTGKVMSIEIRDGGAFIFAHAGEDVDLDKLKFENREAKVSCEIIEMDDGKVVALSIDWVKNSRNAGRKPALRLCDPKLFSLWDDDGSKSAFESDSDKESRAELIKARIDEIGVTEAARRLGVSRPAVYRFLKTLDSQ